MTEKQLHVRVSEEEMKARIGYAKKTKRTKTDILRKFIRSLQNKKPSFMTGF